MSITLTVEITVGRSIKHTRLITLCARTAATWLLAVLPAVFFAPPVGASDSTLFSLESGLTDLVYGLSRSVVTVEVSELLTANRFGSSNDQTYARSVTSGIVVDSAGHILTSAREVLGHDRILVRARQKVTPAEIVAIDYQTELALLKTSEPVGPPVAASTRHSCAGQMVLAISHTSDMCSLPLLGFCAGGRVDGSSQFSLFGAASEVGTCIFDLNGHLVGFVTSDLPQEQNTVVAVPGYQIPSMIDYLLTHGDRNSGFAGITSQEIEISPGFPRPGPSVIPASSTSSVDLIERGVVITSVVASSPAQRAGLMVGDLIYAIDGMPINSASGLANLVRQSAPGTRFDLNILRQTQYLSIPLVIGRKSINLGATTTPATVTDRDRLVDSLKQALQEMQHQINSLQERIQSID